MRSMTGFGRAEVEKNGVRFDAQVRALNQRFFELKLNLPRGWGEHENEIRKLVQGVVARGRVEVFVRRIALRPPSTRLVVNHDLAAQYLSELKRIGKEFRLDGEVGVGAILSRPEIFQVVEEDDGAKSEAELSIATLKRALKAMEADRIREGKALRADMEQCLKRVEAARIEIKRLAEESRRMIVENFQGRVRELLVNLPVDEGRLYEEASSAAQRADISEELARLETHLHGLKELFGRRGPVGKSIEFLLQELNREANTIGSKSQNAVLSRVAISIKGELEKMREQVQNVE
jgi:uncharacterized protein (TIGR00255 family)